MAVVRDRRYWRKLIVFTVIALLAGVLLAWWIIFGIIMPLIQVDGMMRPVRAHVCCVTPIDHGLAYDDVTFATRDGVILSGWYIPSRNRAAVMVLHGLGGNRISRLGAALALAEADYGVLVFDLRAHGESGGDTISYGAEDARAALALLRERDDVDPNRIGALGLSLGAMNIVFAAAQEDGIRALALDGLGQAAFEDFPPPEDVRDFLVTPYRWVGYRALRDRGVSPSAVMDVIGTLAPRPILLISGAGGDLERRTQRRYFAAAGEPKSLWEIPEADHGTTWAARPDEYVERIVAFFNWALLMEP